MKMHFILTVGRNIDPMEDGTPLSRTDTYINEIEVRSGETQSDVLAEIFRDYVGIEIEAATEHTITFYRLVPVEIA